MELWIRSQNRKHLIKAEYVSLMANNIINAASGGWDYDVAKYKTEERALEVLDEIQKIFQPQMIITKPSVKVMSFSGEYVVREKGELTMQELSTYVYEMPKE